MASAVRIFIIAVLISCSSKAAAEEMVMVGAGMQSCGKMLAQESDASVKWMQGYLSAINFLMRDEGTFVDRWCNVLSVNF